MVSSLFIISGVVIGYILLYKIKFFHFIQPNKMLFKRLVFVLFLAGVLVNLFLASWYVAHSDIHFGADIARDFLIFGEIQSKHIIFIGGRTSSGLFHGPLWWYLTYPGYLLGNGNPVAVGWYWIFLLICSLTASFCVARKLFTSGTAYLYVLLLSILYVFHANAFINPHGAMLIMPLFFYSFIRYLQTYRLRYLVFHFLVAGAMIQFEMAVGIPFLFLSLLVIVFSAIRKQKTKHLFALVLIFVSLINFLLFDVRHDFILLKKVIEFATPNVNMGPTTYPLMVLDRVKQMSMIGFLWNNDNFRNLLTTFLFVLFLVLQIRQNKYKTIYYAFFYFYIGFFLLSFINKGYMLPYYIYPILPLPLLLFASCITSKYKHVFLPIFISIYLLNVQSAVGTVNNAKNFIGKDENSWRTVYSLAARAFWGREKELGYFVYSPDAFAYAPQYAMAYAVKMNPQKIAYRFQKKRVTYLLAAPPPHDNPLMLDQWWTTHELKLTKQPVQTITYPNKYKLEKFILTDDDINVPFDPNIDIGL